MNQFAAAQFNINLKWNKGISWSSSSIPSIEVRAKGFAFKDGSLFSQDKLASLFARAITDIPEAERADIILALLAELNGTFAMVLSANQWLFAAVDRVRSTPLFYGLKNDELYLSDDAYCVKQQIENKKLDPLSVKEFMLTGYVTCADTLFDKVKQLQAGECMWCTTSNGRLQVTTHRYYRWIHGEYFDTTEEELYDAMGRMHLRVFERLLESTSRRTIVVPLSGGFDSRLIVAMLKKIGAEKVICFSYGKPSNWESEISRKVAARVGYRWEFIPYSDERWFQEFQSSERSQYFKYAANLTSVPVMTNWPAVRELKNKMLVPEDSIFVPGHTGDFISGGHIPKHWEGKILSNKNLLLEGIWKKHYNLWKADLPTLSRYFEEKNLFSIKGMSWNNTENMASAFECWEWQERQAKFIINSVRVYEFWGYEWRIPLWDNEVMDFFSKVPLELRFKKKLYTDYLFTKVFPEYDIPFTVPTTSFFSRAKNKLCRMLGTYHSGMLFESLYKLIDMSNSSFDHPVNINSYFGVLLLENIKEALRKESLIRGVSERASE